MFKKLSLVGVFCIGLVALWGMNAHALTFKGYTFSLGSNTPIIVTTDWAGVNTEVNAASFSFKMTPFNVDVLFRNPSDKTGGFDSHNFINGGVGIGTTFLFPTLSGKGRFEAEITFGDCDDCADPDLTLPDDGKLWYLFDTGDPSCVDQYPSPSYLSQIDCIKEKLVDDWAPNLAWDAYGVEVYGFDAVLEAFNEDDTENPVIRVTFTNCVREGMVYECDSVNIEKFH